MMACFEGLTWFCLPIEIYLRASEVLLVGALLFTVGALVSVGLTLVWQRVRRRVRGCGEA